MGAPGWLREPAKLPCADATLIMPGRRYAIDRRARLSREPVHAPQGLAAVTEPSDRDLSDRVRDTRDQTAMTMLYDRYSQAVYSLAVAMLHNPAAAEDITQDVFLTFWQNPARYDPDRGPFGPWVLRVTRNRVIDLTRRRRHERPAVEGEVDLTLRLVDPEPGPDDLAWSRSVAREVAGVLKSLPAAQRQAIELAYFQGMTQSEMARHLDIPLGTVKTRVRTALQRLATLMAETDA